MFYLTMHSTHFIYGYMVLETCCCHKGYSFRLAARVRVRVRITQDNTHHGICYTSHGALAGTKNSLGDVKSHMFSITTDNTLLAVKTYFKKNTSVWLTF